VFTASEDEYQLSVTVDDGSGTASSRSEEVILNRRGTGTSAIGTPEALTVAAESTENESLSGNLDSGDNGANAVFSLTNYSAGGSLTIEPDGRYSFIPGSDFDSLAEGETQTVTATYSVSNGYFTSDASIEFTVTGTNDAPVISRTEIANPSAADVNADEVSVVVTDGPTVTTVIKSLALQDGSRVVMWHETDPDADPVTARVKIQHLDTDGNALAPAFDPFGSDIPESYVPDMALTADGNMKVVWTGGPGATDADDKIVRVQEFTTSGVSVGGQVEVTTGDTGKGGAAITVLSDGGFAVVWHQFGSSISIDGGTTYHRIYNEDGSPRTDAEIVARSSGTRPWVTGEYGPTVESDGIGGFVIMTSIYDASYPFGTRVTNNGTMNDGIFFDDGANEQHLTEPGALTILSDGGFVYEWVSNPSFRDSDAAVRTIVVVDSDDNKTAFIDSVPFSSDGSKTDPVVVRESDNGIEI
ncbi:MAG: VCBS domain-containing protein, partial [Rhodospirillales bacterium]